MLGNCENMQLLSYLQTGLTAVFLWWAYLDTNGKRNDLRRLWQHRVRALLLTLIIIELVLISSYFFVSLANPLLFGAILALVSCLREALDPSQPSLWHHRRIRPVALLLIPMTSALGAWFVASPTLYAAIVSIAVFSRHLQSGARLNEQSLSEIEPLQQKIQSLNAALQQHNLYKLAHPDSLSGISSNEFLSPQNATLYTASDSARRA